MAGRKKANNGDGKKKINKQRGTEIVWIQYNSTTEKKIYFFKCDSVSMGITLGEHT